MRLNMHHVRQEKDMRHGAIPRQTQTQAEANTNTNTNTNMHQVRQEKDTVSAGYNNAMPRQIQTQENMYKYKQICITSGKRKTIMM